MNQQLVHLIIVLIIVGGSVMKVVFNKLQEQAAKRRAQQEAERRRLEALRTGRDVEPGRPAAPMTQDPRQAPQDLEQLARKRAAQLQELRRMQQQRQRAGGAASPSASADQVILRVPGSSGPTVPGTRPTPLPMPAGRAPPGRPPQRPMPAQRPPRQDRRPAPRPQPAPPRQAAPSPKPRPAPAPEIADRPEPQPPATSLAEPAPHAPNRMPVLWGTRAPDWRRAFLMSEILSAPVSSRAGEPGPLARRF